MFHIIYVQAADEFVAYSDHDDHINDGNNRDDDTGGNVMFSAEMTHICYQEVVEEADGSSKKDDDEIKCPGVQHNEEGNKEEGDNEVGKDDDDECTPKNEF